MERIYDVLRLESVEENEAIVRATMTTLGERLTTPQRTNLSAQLPGELKHLLFERQRTRRFSLEDFYKRVSSRADLRYSAGAEQARAVMSVLQEAISPGERDKLLDELPPEYSELFEEPAGPRSTSL